MMRRRRRKRKKRKWEQERERIRVDSSPCLFKSQQIEYFQSER